MTTLDHDVKTIQESRMRFLRNTESPSCSLSFLQMGAESSSHTLAGGSSGNHDQEGGHPLIGMEFLRKYNESEAVMNAALAHHGDVPATTPYTPLVMAADAISASRPGARRESLERYVTRLRDLEELATGFEGV